ncbi:MAG: dienelactone hydrolase family protein [Trebonia sp.]
MTATRKQVTVAGGGVTLPGDLTVPDDPAGLVLFAHGSGSSRRSPRNRAVAASLNAAGFCTLLFDLLTADEERRDARTGELRFDIPLLARRLTAAVDWLDGSAEQVGQLPYGLFGASTGAAAALVTAAARPGRIRAVVSRGGRPDLAGPLLADLRAPVLLIVGGADAHVLALNEAILGDLPVGSDLAVVPGASHLFAEPGALDQVAALAAGWFTRHVGDVDRG